jgi:hypothetical protein
MSSQEIIKLKMILLNSVSKWRFWGVQRTAGSKQWTNSVSFWIKRKRQIYLQPRELPRFKEEKSLLLYNPQKEFKFRIST